MQIDLGNVQLTVLQRYKYSLSRHLIFRFGQQDAAQAFIRVLTPLVTMADIQLDSTPDPLRYVGLTYNGLRALGVDPARLQAFEDAFKRGPDPFRLGDVPGSPSDPANWWEGQFNTEDVHCIVQLHFRSDNALESASAEIRDLAGQSGVTELIPRADGTVLDARTLGGGTLHFGYTDGISHFDIGWDDEPVEPTQTNFRNFLLGYSTIECSSAPKDGDPADFVRDSTYAAFRWLYQDVATFNQFLRTEGPRQFPHLSPADAEELLAAKMMGRWRDGTPLVLSPNHPAPGLWNSNDFGYKQDDMDGYKCPFSAHIRVVNPRDQDLDSAEVEGVPRVIRRGMPYGPVLNSTDDDGQDRGIIGIFLCASIHRQIYKLTGWIKQNTFSPVYDKNRRVQDVLVGNRAVPELRDHLFILPAPDGGTTTVTGLPDFVHTKGTVFLLLPSKSTLQKIAGAS